MQHAIKGQWLNNSERVDHALPSCLGRGGVPIMAGRTEPPGNRGRARLCMECSAALPNVKRSKTSSISSPRPGIKGHLPKGLSFSSWQPNKKDVQICCCGKSTSLLFSFLVLIFLFLKYLTFLSGLLPGSCRRRCWGWSLLRLRIRSCLRLWPCPPRLPPWWLLRPWIRSWLRLRLLRISWSFLVDCAILCHYCCFEDKFFKLTLSKTMFPG